MKKDTIVIKISPHSEGGLNYDIWPEDLDIEAEPYDGGICTSGMHNKDCDDDDCEGCPEAMEKPYTRKDYENALDMAKEQALDLLFPKK